MPRFIAAALALGLLIIGCSGRPSGIYDLKSKPSIRLLVDKKLVNTNQKFFVTALLYGAFPRGQLGIVYSAEDLPVHASTIDTSMTRAKRLGMKFTWDFYMQVKREHEGGDSMLGRNRWFQNMNSSECPDIGGCKWDEYVDIMVAVYELEWTTEGGYELGKQYASATTRVKLSCPSCFT